MIIDFPTGSLKQANSTSTIYTEYAINKGLSSVYSRIFALMSVSKDKKSRIPLTRKILDELHAQKDRTKVGAIKLLKEAKDVPEVLTADIINKWLEGRVKTASKNHLDFVLKRWKSLPGFSPLDDKTRARLRSYSEKTGVGPERLLKNADEIPEGLSPSKISHWLSGSIKNVHDDHLKFVLKEWEKYPQYERAEITETMRKTLLEYRNKTDTGPQALLRNTRHKRPKGLSSSIIQNWLDGSAKSVRKDHLDYVLKRWAHFPIDQDRVQITHEILEELQFHRKRSGTAPQRLIKEADNVPDGLSSAIIHRWLYKKISTARPDHLEFVLDAWKALPDDHNPKGKRKSYSRFYMPGNYVSITDKIRNRLVEYKDKSGIGAERLLNNDPDCPDGLTHSMINGWLYDKTKTAFKDHLDYVLKKWKRLCEDNDRIKLTDVVLEELKSYRKQEFLPGQIFKGAGDIPEGLSPHLISSWFTNQTSSAKKDHVEYVLKRCKELENSQKRRIKITDKMRGALLEQRERTGIGQKALLDRSRTPPEGLSAGTISDWINGYSQTTRKDHFDYVLSRWKRLPDLNDR